MKKIYRVIIIIVLLLGSITAKSQNDAIGLTLLPHVPYNNLYNPALPVSSNMYVGVGISNINLSFYNSSIRFNDVYNYENGKPVSINAASIIDGLDEHDNFINSNFSLDILRVGYRYKKLFFNVDWKVRYNSEFHYSKDFLGFFVNGNAHYMGDNYADFSIGVNMDLISEIAVGVQYQVNDKLIVAARPKLICGAANITVDNDKTKIYTDANTYDMTADVNFNVKYSTLLDFKFDKIGDLMSMDPKTLNMTDLLKYKDNFGFGIDLGASYVINENFGVAAGIYDLGFIKWTNTREKHHIQDNVVVNDALCDDFEDVMNLELNFEDLVRTVVEDVWGDGQMQDGEDYKTALKTRFMLQGYYEMNPMLRITAVGQLNYANDKMRPSLTLAYSGSFSKIVDLTASYTASRCSGNSIAAGVSFNLGPVRLYAVTDNMLMLTKIASPMVKMLTSYDVVNVRFGLIFTM